MWKKITPNKVKKKNYQRIFRLLDFDICNENTTEVDYDYLVMEQII